VHTVTLDDQIEITLLVKVEIDGKVWFAEPCIESIKQLLKASVQLPSLGQIQEFTSSIPSLGLMLIFPSL
jgi:hypothetical protein